MWLTNKKTGKVFNTDWLDEDAKRKAAQISANESYAKGLNRETAKPVKSDRIKDVYKKYSRDDRYKMRDDFFNDTNITINHDVIEKCNTENLGAVLDTVSQIRREYKTNVTNIALATDKMVGDNPLAWAWMGQDGSLYLNAEMYSKSWNEFNACYVASVKSKHHPKGDAHAVIAHELGHSIYNNSIVKIVTDYSDSNTSFANYVRFNSAIHEFMFGKKQADGKFNYGNYDINVAKESSAYKEVVRRIDDLSKSLQNDAYIKNIWGGRVNLGLMGLANPELSSSGIFVSRYATNNYGELIAEAFADVYMNQENASYVSKKVYEMFLKEMKK